MILIIIVIVPIYGRNEDVKITVKITNIEDVKGFLEISFYNRSDDFPKENKQYKMKRVKVSSPSMSVSFELPKGVWALAMYQDLNNDKKCNLNFFGIPREPYGFSNNVKPILSAPSFDRCKFNLYKPKTISVKLIH